jgi:hypothetical protein
MERSVVEGALESARRDTARLQREQGIEPARRAAPAMSVVETPLEVRATHADPSPVETVPGPSVQPDRSA